MPHEPPDDAPLRRLQRWYANQCDGEWEHDYGVDIGTLDNPGWTLRVDLTGTPLAGRSFGRLENHRGEHDWLVCWIEQHQFHAACGPRNLDEAIETFLEWAE